MDEAERAERSLLQRLVRGDERAWGQVFETHRDRIYGLCLRMMRNREEAEDISQEVFLRAVRAIGTFRGDASLKTWLHQIAHNLCLTRLTAAKKGMEYLCLAANRPERQFAERRTSAIGGVR